MKAGRNAERVVSTFPSFNQVQKLIDKGIRPKTVVRLDHRNLGVFEKPHITFKNTGETKHALNIDGTWKHGGRTLSNEEIEFLNKIGWTLPK